MARINMELSTQAANAAGLESEDKALVHDLMETWRVHHANNLLRDEYYHCHRRVKDLGISMPPALAKKIDPRVDWPKKSVHALADRSIFNGFTCDDDETNAKLKAICDANEFEQLYRMNLIGELKHCCGFWTVTTKDKDSNEPIISAYPATAAAGLWDFSQKHIQAGLVVAESKKLSCDSMRVPTVVHLFTEDNLVVLKRTNNGWAAEYREHGMGRCLMEPMAHGKTLERPFGASRITQSVMRTTDDAIRQRARMEAAAESATLPQMWVLGTYKKMINDQNKYDASMGAINEITKDPDGDKPTIWQSAQLQMAPHIEYLRQLACQMSEETNVPVSFFGVASDNPSSADAIAASLEPLIIDAKNLNRSNAIALRNVAYMALAVVNGTDYATERDAGYNLNPRFLSPAYPSIASQSDAVLKQVQAIPKLANSSVIYELLDYTEEQIQRIESDNKKAQASAAIASLFAPKEDGTDGGNSN
jgi:hypothetical protein